MPIHTTHLARVTLSLAAACLLLAPISRAARADDIGEAGETDEGPELDSEKIFGFTEGTDTGEKGEQELSFELFGAFERAKEDSGSSHYRALGGEGEYEYAITDNWTLSGSASAQSHSIHNVAELEDLHGGGFNGLAVESKYRFLNRETAPIGLAFSIEPEWNRFDDGSGEREDSFELTMKLMADANIIGDRLLGAVNFIYAPEWSREGGESDIEVSGALSIAITPQVRLGGELRYLLAYEGAALDRFEGGALYIGPSCYFQLTDAAYLKAAYSYQIVGSSSEADTDLDLGEHERHQFLAGFGVEF